MKILIVIGTRPEAIKMAPLVRRLKLLTGIETKLCNTGQHKELLEPVLDFFELKVDYSLDVMQQNQALHALTAAILQKIQPVYEEFKPDYVLVHGDTTTSFAAALAAFYAGIKVGHVEAGLRTRNKLAPFPEEMNRSLTARLSDVHFAPTVKAQENLLTENLSGKIIVTGNTVIDALLDGLLLVNDASGEIELLKKLLNNDKKIILFTGHRRENFGAGFESVFAALKSITDKRDDVIIIYPVHPNPMVKLLAEKFFGNSNAIHLIDPLSYGPFIWLMQQAFLILTDSGGIQEEAPSLRKPVLVLRDVTERPEAVATGTVILVGTDKEKIENHVYRLLDDNAFYQEMVSLSNPYGDGKASERIIEYLTGSSF